LLFSGLICRHFTVIPLLLIVKIPIRELFFVTMLQRGIFPYFCPVNKSVAIKEQFIALLLAAVFLFIHIGKVLHTHENKIPSEAGYKTEQVSKTAECSICDFHLTKDTEQNFAAVIVSKLPIPKQEFLSYQSRTASSIGLTYTDRGPPAVA
jgi:hypothetical protein